MGRRSTIDEQALFGIIGLTMAQEGLVSIQSIVEQTGVSIGSLYHRYKSRQGLLAAAWFDAIDNFQKDFLEILPDCDRQTGVEAALLTPRFSRLYHDRAVILSCCRKTQFINENAYEERAALCNSQNARMANEMKAFAKRTGLALDDCYIGIVHYPMAVIRAYLPKRKVPLRAEQHVRSAYLAATSQNEIHNT